MPESQTRILCVDDQQDISFVVKAVLDLIGHNVTTAGSVSEALEATREARFDLYMLDGRLPDGTGRELRQKLREIHPSVPALFFTGVDYLPEEVQALRQQGDDYLQKPASPIEIQMAVQRLL